MSRDQFTIQGRWVYSSGPELMATLCARMTEHLLNVTRRVLSRADDALFAAAQAASANDRAVQLDAMRQLRQLRLPLERSMTHAVEAAFGTLHAAADTVIQEATLSLLDDDQVVIQREADAAALAVLGVHGPALDAIARRFAVLRGVRELAPEHNPLSATRLGGLLLVAQSDMSIPVPARKLLYSLFASELVDGLAPVLSEINNRLMGAGVLVELGNPRPVELPSDTSDTVIAESDPEVSASAPVVSVDDQQFSELCQLLHAFRPHEPEGAAEVAETSRTYGSDEVMSVLSLMQPEMPASVSAALERREVSLAALLKQELVDAASRIGLSPAQLRLQPEDEDAVDLVGMLFDVMFDERDFKDDARFMIAKLVVPFVKAALVDRSLFTVKTHPARRLLNTVVDACEGNRGDAPQERELLSKAEATVARLVCDFNQDVSIFETLEHELSAFVAQHNQRIALAERRAAEAQRGQDRLSQARDMAQQTLARYRAGRELPIELEDFLEHYWTHHLSMVALREGAHSPAWQMAAGVAERLMALLPQDGQTPLPVSSVFAGLRPSLDGILASSGVTGEAAKALQVTLAQRLESLARGESVGSTKPALRVASVQSAPTVSPPVSNNPPQQPLAMVADTTQHPVDAAALDRIRRLQLGAWLHVLGDDGNSQDIKLSWISPITSRLMFVNRRGVRVLVASVEELARMHSEGRLEIRDSAQVFDQVVDRMIHRLQSGSA